MNRLYYGDCLTVMQEEMRSESVDLIYLDPPFNSNRQYNAIYKDETGRLLPDQVEAFCDMWELDAERERAIRDMPVMMRQNGVDDATAEFWRLWMNALRNTQPRLLAYLSYMAERLLTMRRILKPTGSLYLHCDPTASHYVKALLDAIFGHGNFRNEIVWQRTFAHGGARRWGPIHDTLLFYTATDNYTWNLTYQEHAPAYLKKSYNRADVHGSFQPVSLTGAGTRQGESGKPWRGVDPTQAGRHWAVPDRGLPSHFERPDGYGDMTVQERLDVLDASGLIYWPPRGVMPRFKRYAEMSPGNPRQDVVTDIPPASGDEDMGYDTQKPRALLERIIAASSNPGDVIFDPFCGCATTLEAAHMLGRQWVGIDIAIHAVKRVTRVRLEQRLGLIEGQSFTIEGVPRDVEGARDLWRRDPYHFQKWAVEQADGFVTSKRTADGGIDGRLYFAVPEEQSLQSMVMSVKGGKGNIAEVRDLRGVLERDPAMMAGLIVLDRLPERQARNFEREMALAGATEILGIEYPRMQMLSVPDLLDGRRFHTPSVAGRNILEPQLPGLPRH